MTAATWGRVSDAPATLVLTGGRVLDPGSGTDGVRDLGICDGVIVDVASLPPEVERLDARDLVVVPGLVDLHAHLREPGTEGETIQSGARAAAHGGFTTICAMPNTDPALDDAETVGALVARTTTAACRVRVIAAATHGRRGKRVADIERLSRSGAVGVSDDGASVPDAIAREAMASLARVGVPLFEHAEDSSLTDGAVMRAGTVAVRLGLRGWPPEAETGIVRRDLRLAAETGARVHLTHLSTRRAVEAVRAAKAQGVSVTADVTPHHLAMTDSWVAGSRRFAWEDGGDRAAATQGAYDGSCRVNPPLPSFEDAEVLMDAVRDGTIDAIATDHAPHPPERKAVPFGEAAPGIIGLETALSLGLAAVAAGRLGLATLIAALTTRPAALIGERRGLEIGDRADLVAFEPGATWRVEPSALASMSSNTPLLGMELPGVVRLTVADGRVTYRS